MFKLYRIVHDRHQNAYECDAFVGRIQSFRGFWNVRAARESSIKGDNPP